MQINKLDKMEARFISLEDQLSDPSVIADQNKWRELSKEHSELAEVVSKYREYKEVLDQAKEALEILGDKSQSDLHELAKEELKESEKRRDELDLEIFPLATLRVFPELVCLRLPDGCFLWRHNDSFNVLLYERHAWHGTSWTGNSGDAAALEEEKVSVPYGAL